MKTFDFSKMLVGLSLLVISAFDMSLGARAASPPPSAPSPTASPDASSSSATASNGETYKLGTGDKVRVTVFGQDDLGGEFVIDDTGVVRLPMIGQVKAADLTVHDFEDAVIAKLQDGYLVNPRVSVEVISYRPFYIMGEVNKPGEYPCETGMTVLNAVSLAGGFTYRADETEVYIRHKNSSGEEKRPADVTTPVQPGDIIRVAERFF